MIIVKGIIPVKPQRREEAVSLVQRLAAISRKESGCMSYEVYLQADCLENIMVFQQWFSVEALERHFASEHVDLFLEEIPDLIDGQVTSMHFDVISRDDIELGVEAYEDGPGDDGADAAVLIADNVTVH